MLDQNDKNMYKKSPRREIWVGSGGLDFAPAESGFYLESRHFCLRRSIIEEPNQWNEISWVSSIRAFVEIPAVARVLSRSGSLTKSSGRISSRCLKCQSPLSRMERERSFPRV